MLREKDGEDATAAARDNMSPGRPYDSKAEGAGGLDAAERGDLGDGEPPRRFGVMANKVQFCVHMVLSVLVGVLLRLTVFPQASMAADLAGADPSNTTAQPVLLGATPAPPPVVKANFHAYQTAFLVSFGITKALSNMAIGGAADRLGRRRTHISGWVFGVLLAAMLLLAEGSWTVIVLANVLLGAMQAVTWSTNIFMVMDILGPRQRAIASALANAGGYVGSAGTAFLAAGLIEHGGYDAAFVGVLVSGTAGLVLSVCAVEETLPFVKIEAAQEGGAAGTHARPAPHSGHREMVGSSDDDDDDDDDDIGGDPVASEVDPRPHPLRNGAAGAPGGGGGDATPPAAVRWSETAWRTTIGNPSAGINCLVGFAVNAITGLVWGYLIIWVKHQHLGSYRTATVNAVYSFSKGALLVPAGILSDRLLRRSTVIIGGLVLLALGLLLIMAAGSDGRSDAQVFLLLVLGCLALGVGTGLIYPTISASVGDQTPAVERASALGVFRFWRDLGYAAGGLLPSLVASRDDSTSFFNVNAAFVVLIVSVTVLYAVVYREKAARGR